MENELCDGLMKIILLKCTQENGKIEKENENDTAKIIDSFINESGRIEKWIENVNTIQSLDSELITI